MRKLLFLLLVLSVGVFVSACGSGTGATPVASATEAPTASATPAAANAAPDPAAGEALFAQQTIGDNPGCVTCHSLKPGETLVGPSLAGIGPDAAGDAEEAGLSTEEMLKQMIVDPNAELAGDFAADIMPQDWGTKLSDAQLNDLIAYLMTLK